MSSASRLAGKGVATAVAVIAIAAAMHHAHATSANHITLPDRTAVVVPSDPHELRVCSDPNNLPFSNDHLEGFENEIASLVASDLEKKLTYYWMPQRRGFIRNTLAAGFCDVVMGVPASLELARTTRPYYRSTYVFLSRGGGRPVTSLDDPALEKLRIGVQITGNDYANPPGAQALAARRLGPNVRGYTVYGDYSTPDPQRAIVDAVARDEVDTAIVWGPQAGYFARQEGVRLELSPVTPALDPLSGPFTFEIAMAVRKNDDGLRDALNAVIAKKRREIERILRRYGVPLVDDASTELAGSKPRI